MDRAGRAHAPLFGLGGGFALSLMVIPVTLRATEQFLRQVPRRLREGALALGASKWRTVATVVIPAARTGIMTGIILGVARSVRRNRAAAVYGSE